MNFGQNKTGGKNQQYGNSNTANEARGKYMRGKSAKKKRKNKYAGGTTSGFGNNKIWMAALAGASAGVIAGLLMAPESGKGNVDTLKRTAMKLGDQLDNSLRVAMDKLENMGLTRSGDSLQVQGNWDNIKGKMKSQYGDLTDQDLTYLEGKEDDFLGNLEIKLGKSKRELVSWINSLT
jgi:uncharacterized protein YjbJ (UPF0337 family)